MKNAYMLLSLASLLALAGKDLQAEVQVPAVTKDKILVALVRSHAAVFSKENFFNEPVQPQEWYRFLNELKKFVNDNAKGDKKLLGALDTILENNDTLVNSIKITYNALFAKGGQYQETVAKSALQKFDQVKSAMVTIQKEITKEYYMYQSKKEVRQVLEQVALFVESTATKAGNDVRRRMPQKSSADADKGMPTAAPS